LIFITILFVVIKITLFSVYNYITAEYEIHETHKE